ncbi:MAG: Formylmethanofuran--tetrahydromethanopterin formyltransferase [Candidatus Methanophagaceae archaeon]|nr:MAG: Formylmethanofuran--tetrahydromethanopterin formyltransferase [Methanophagales archaeon]KAF5436228.1 formylmethanofuran--tetrahydromethanopterin N-formyltransferase [Methanophagales archaeon]
MTDTLRLAAGFFIGVSRDVVIEAMKAVIDSVRDVTGLVKISAGNYGGKLGKYKIYLEE